MKKIKISYVTEIGGEITTAVYFGNSISKSINNLFNSIAETPRILKVVTSKTTMGIKQFKNN